MNNFILKFAVNTAAITMFLGMLALPTGLAVALAWWVVQ